MLEVESYTYDYLLLCAVLRVKKCVVGFVVNYYLAIRMVWFSSYAITIPHTQHKYRNTQEGHEKLTAKSF
jgi:hypothetical protein